MAKKEDLVGRIVVLEWKMFQDVENVGGRASCQDDPATFEINRSAQVAGWSEAALESYLGDLLDAEKAGRNMLSEKYARMMESTSPSEYALIEHLLPALAPEVPSLVDGIVNIVLEWEDALAEKYPRILRRGRPVHSRDDGPFGPSLETYLRGELATYSPRTLRLLYENAAQQKTEGVNASELVLDATMQRYGFRSLAEANTKL
ncbi:MAG: DUF4125 family protein [Chloroflexi bacterium]|nr:DUF4125 family protein [Chloroflexota bacterium]